MYASSKWYHFCSGVCNVSNANILFLWIEIMMFWLCNNWWRWNRSNYTPAGAAGVGFDATYDALVNTLISEG
jgi:hypothetical protein